MTDDLQNMNEIFDLTTRPKLELFTKKINSNSSYLGDIVSTKNEDYSKTDIVILGLQNGENKNSKFCSDEIRREFYKLTSFGINRKIFDLGNFQFEQTTADDFLFLTKKILSDKKRLILLGRAENSSYFVGRTMGNVFGNDRWLAINIDSHLDSHLNTNENNEAPFRKLLEEKLIVPKYFYEIGFQPYFCSPLFYRFLQNNGVKMVSLEQLRSRETADLELRELIRQEFIQHSRSMSIFFNFSMNAVRASDAPGGTSASPFGLRAGEFLTLVQFAAKLVNTKVIQFTDLDSNSDLENRTAKLASIALHRFCSTLAEN